MILDVIALPGFSSSFCFRTWLAPQFWLTIARLDHHTLGSWSNSPTLITTNPGISCRPLPQLASSGARRQLTLAINKEDTS